MVVALLPPVVVVDALVVLVVPPVVVELAVVDEATDVELPGLAEVEEEDAPPLLPGRHWEYQLFEKVHVDPEAHVVGPVQPWPPPGTVSCQIANVIDMLTLSPKVSLSQNSRCKHRSCKNEVLDTHCDEKLTEIEMRRKKLTGRR